MQNHYTLDYSDRFAYDLVSAEEFDRSGPRPRTKSSPPGASPYSLRRGDVIGLAGNNGNNDGPHLHYNLKDRTESNRRQALPTQFRNLFVDGEWLERGEPVQGQRIRRR